MLDLSSEAVLALNTLLTGGVAFLWKNWDDRRKEKIDRQEQRITEHEERLTKEIDRLDRELEEEREARKLEEAAHQVTRDTLNRIQGAVFAYRRCPQVACPFRNGHGDELDRGFRPYDLRGDEPTEGSE